MGETASACQDVLESFQGYGPDGWWQITRRSGHSVINLATQQGMQCLRGIQIVDFQTDTGIMLQKQAQLPKQEQMQGCLTGANGHSASLEA